MQRQDIKCNQSYMNNYMYVRIISGLLDRFGTNMVLDKQELTKFFPKFLLLNNCTRLDYTVKSLLTSNK